MEANKNKAFCFVSDVQEAEDKVVEFIHLGNLLIAHTRAVCFGGYLTLLHTFIADKKGKLGSYQIFRCVETFLYFYN